MLKYVERFTILFLTFLLLGLSLTSCSTTKKYRRKFFRKLEQIPVFQQQFTGFALYDPSKKEWLIEKNPDHYFTPASNTKILTLYAGLQILGERIPVLQYKIEGDSLVFWGTGHPGFLHPELPQDSTAYLFLKHWPGPIFFSSENYRDQRYGNGWMWDDYPYAFQAEKSPFPIYGNLVKFNSPDNGTARPFTKTFFFDQQLIYKPGNSWISRLEEKNTFLYNNHKKEAFTRSIPFRYSDTLFVKLLTESLERSVEMSFQPIEPDSNSQVLYGKQLIDSLYQYMMQESDNFIAEQILLLCSQQIANNLHAKTTINFVNDSLSPSTKPLIWEDGSGLSRYNMLTPRSLIEVLEQLWEKTNRNRLLNIFPAGGQSGSIKQDYMSSGQPYVFAKTGTLRHNHCLSGYLQTKSGRWLIFSFMNNHFSSGSKPVKQEMQELLRWIYENY